jgi:CDP-glucose 4,6-dehydratase
MPPTNPNFHETLSSNVFAGQTQADIRDYPSVVEVVRASQPEIVFHMAAQPLVRRSYVDPLETLGSNPLGTAHVLEALRQERVNCVSVIITSDKCYENREWSFAYRETDALGGHDVYSMSKAATELVAQSWDRSFFKDDDGLGPIVTVRAGNVIGGGDYAVDRILPDCIRALSSGDSIKVRNPGALRPWQHVLECLSGYLWLGARLAEEGKDSPLATAFNFGPDATSRMPVRALVEEVLEHWPGRWEDQSDPSSPHEAALLALTIDKASAMLGWSPVWTMADAVKATVEWYRARHVDGEVDMQNFSKQQIDGYAESAKNKGLPWTS